MPKRPEVKPKATPSWRMWLRISIWAGIFVGVAWGSREVHSFLLSDPRFRLENLEIHGAKYTSTARIQTVFTNDLGKSVFQLPLAERRRHLLAIDWIRTAAITRVWPNRILVTISERTPATFAKLPIAGSVRHWMALMDTDGVLLSVPQKVRFRLPVLSGVSEEQTEAERHLRVEAMEHLLNDLGPEARDISEINMASTQDVRVTAAINGRGVELLLGDQHYRSRYRNFLAHYEEIRKHSDSASLFDLRIDDRISAR